MVAHGFVVFSDVCVDVCFLLMFERSSFLILQILCTPKLPIAPMHGAATRIDISIDICIGLVYELVPVYLSWYGYYKVDWCQYWY